MTYLVKSLIRPDRVRMIPNSFSWVDRRFLGDGYLEQLSHEATLLYFFLVTVSDAQGLSFYGDRRIETLLKMSEDILDRARGALIDIGLIAYRPPLYQVLDIKPLDPLIVHAPSTGSVAIGSLLKNTKRRKP
jgi:hypothetical protein